mgnify:CR=1 FL=1
MLMKERFKVLAEQNKRAERKEFERGEDPEGVK